MKLVALVAHIAKKYGATSSQIAISWILHQDESFVPIPGTKRISYLEENSASVDLNLDDDDIEELNSIFGQTSGPRYGAKAMAMVER
jgi:aryl-alcohol dehydrogenase-like predicted oxidoreductase